MIVRALLCLLLANTPWVVVHAAPQPTLIYAFSTFEPYKILDSAGNPAGAYTLLLQELARRSQLQLDIVQCPLQRCLSLLQHGNADISIGIRNSDQRDHYLEFINPPFAPATGTVLLQRHNDTRPIRHYDDLYPLRVGVVEGASYFQHFDRDLKIQRDTSPNAQLALKKLAAKRFDVLLINSKQAGTLNDKTGTMLFRRAQLQFPGESPRRIVISRRSAHAQAVKQQLSRQLQQMLRDGSVQRILGQDNTASKHSK